MKTKKLLSIALSLVLILSMFVTAVPVVSATIITSNSDEKNTSKICNVNYLRDCGCIYFSNRPNVVEYGKGFYTVITLEENTKITSIAVTMGKDTLICPTFNEDCSIIINIPVVTNDITIGVIVNYTWPDTIVGDGYMMSVTTKLDNISLYQSYEPNSPGMPITDSIFENLVRPTELVVVPDEGYEIISLNGIYRKIDRNKNELITEKAKVEKKSDGSYVLPIVRGDNINLEGEVRKIGDTQPTDPTKPTEPTVKNPTISPASASLRAGAVKTVKVKDGKVKSWTTSNKKIATVKNGKVTALNKGAVKITATLTTGEKLTCKVKVTTAPKLQKKKVTVKKGKTVSVKLTGKATSIKNKYTNTKRAKIVSKTNAKTIKVKGLKKGTTTLKVKVNGIKTLPLKVIVR